MKEMDEEKLLFTLERIADSVERIAKALNGTIHTTGDVEVSGEVETRVNK